MKILFRVDGSAKIGTGHVMRCLALADGFVKAADQCVFVTRNYDRAIINKIRVKKHRLGIIPHKYSLKEDLRFTLRCIKRYLPDVVVTDSYDLNADYLRQLVYNAGGNHDRLLVSIDDLARIRFCSDIVLNQNINAQPRDYRDKSKPGVRLLLGTKYALLRDEFSKSSFAKNKFPDRVRNVLVTLGGSDPDNQTLKVVRAMKAIKGDFTITVVLGVGFKHARLLKTLISKNRQRIILRGNINNMAELMRKSDLAISAGGTTCWELACLGVPNIIITLARNQEKIAERLGNQGVSISLGWFKKVTQENIRSVIGCLVSDPKKRKQMSEKGRKLVDGQGVARVINEIKRRR